VRGKPVVGITAGDPSGIGPEVVARALADGRVQRALVPVVFGDASLEQELRGFHLLDPNDPSVRPARATLCAVTRLLPGDRAPGRPSRLGGRAQLRYIQAAVAAARAGFVDALCTAPVSKGGISAAGERFVGHTELLAEAFDCEVLMLMEGPRVRVALATNHLPLAKVARALKTDTLVAQLKLLSKAMRTRLGRAPRIAVCGLNPHAGDGGLLGREEVDVIAPAIARARKAGVRCEGPYAADGLFAQADKMPCDVVLAMYHDQGLVAAKALDFDRTVNVTLGLPLPRTSPDHGVAYDIAGTGRASAEPMVAALLAAAR